MNISSHNIMNGLRKWIMEEDWNVIRFHISHNDLDGYACHVMTRLATNVLNPNSKSSLTFWTSSAGTENIERTITRFIDRMATIPKDPKKQYIKGKKKLFILLTDLGNFNPEFLNDLIRDGHLINYLYIDHHQVIEGYDKVELVDNKDEFQMAENCYYVDHSMSATKSISNAVQAIILQKRTASMLSHSALENMKTSMKELNAYTNRVDNFDLGIWGKWTDLDASKIDESVAEYLFFKSYPANEKYKYVSLLANYFHTIMLGYHNTRQRIVDVMPFWVLDIDNFRSRRFSVIKSQLKELNDELNYCKEHLKPVSIQFVIPDTISNKDDLKIYEIDAGNESIMSFTLVSREILNEHQDIDILLMVFAYLSRKGVDMRTTKDEINLFEIAAANGGGGHPKAAGFPLKIDDNKEELL